MGWDMVKEMCKEDWGREGRFWGVRIIGEACVESGLKVYLSTVEGTNRRGRPLGRWKDRVKEYVSVRGVRGNALEWTRREFMDQER